MILELDPANHVFGPETTPGALFSAARKATRTALTSSTGSGGSAMMEPYMNVTISVDEASLGAVTHDLSATRSGFIVSLDEPELDTGSGGIMGGEVPLIDTRKVYAPRDPFDVQITAGMEQEDVNMASNETRSRTIRARVPLKEMVGYLKHLRSLTGGRGTFVMTVDKFEKVSGKREKLLLKELRGY